MRRVMPSRRTQAAALLSLLSLLHPASAQSALDDIPDVGEDDEANEFYDDDGGARGYEEPRYEEQGYAYGEDDMMFGQHSMGQHSMPHMDAESRAAAVTSLFSMLDQDTDGRLSPEELERGLKLQLASFESSLRKAHTVESKRLLSDADLDADGRLTLSELQDSEMRPGHGLSPETFFAFADAGEDGSEAADDVLTAEELAAALFAETSGRLGEYQAVVVRSVLEAHDETADRALNVDELARYQLAQMLEQSAGYFEGDGMHACMHVHACARAVGGLQRRHPYVDTCMHACMHVCRWRGGRGPLPGARGYAAA